MEFSPNINVISGENSTGKTALIKLLYSVLKGFAEACTVKGDLTKDKLETALVDKLQGVFRPDNNAVGKSQTRKQVRCIYLLKRLYRLRKILALCIRIIILRLKKPTMI